MSFQISEFLGIFSVHGKLNVDNVPIFKRHMNTLLKRKSRLVLNLERTEEMDAQGAFALKELVTNASEFDCSLTIFGRNNKNILPVLKRTNICDMFSDFM